MTDAGQASIETSAYADAIVIDALNVSNWDSPAVFKCVRAGAGTAYVMRVPCGGGL